MKGAQRTTQTKDKEGRGDWRGRDHALLKSARQARICQQVESACRHVGAPSLLSPLVSSPVHLFIAIDTVVVGLTPVTVAAEFEAPD